MKPAHRTVSYVVYEANYRPGMRHVKAKQLADAKRICRRFGHGAEIVRCFSVKNRRRSSSWMEVARPFIYTDGSRRS
jgi:hypothetical protein